MPATSGDVSAIFFMSNEEDLLLIDLEQVFNIENANVDPVSVAMTVTSDSALDSSTISFLENYVLVNSFHLRYNLADNDVNSLGTFYTKQDQYVYKEDIDTSSYVNYNNESLVYSIKLLKGIDTDLQLKLNFDVSIGSGPSKTYTTLLYLDDNLSSKQEILKDSGNCIDTESASFMLAYTNPRLTGNVKLVVDSDYRLYLDTFKASRILCNNNYRHQPISYEGNYAHDVYTIFNSLPNGEIYKVHSDSYDPHKVYTNYDDQYWTMYQYGAETNDDFLYSENMKILAPLYIKRSLPDFFAIFRVDEYYNPETYDNVLDDYQKFEQLLTEGKIVKIFDLRKYTSIGQYLNNYAESIADIASPVFLQFQEQDRDELDIKAKYKNGTNIWTGISLDKGVIVNKSETTYFSNKILNENKYVQEDFNMFLIDGFQRNNILYPNIINLEFMFNDEKSKTYTMHKYFGLYLKENAIKKFAGAVKDSLVSNTYKIFDDEWNKDSSTDSFIGDVTVDDYKDRIIFGVTPVSADRITNYEEYRDFITEKVVNKPYTNEINIVGNKVLKEDEGWRSFISMRFTEPIKYGEHFKFIIKHHFDTNTRKYKNVILEIIASNDKRLANTVNNINPYVLTNHTYGNGVLTEGYMFRTSDELTPQSGYYNSKGEWVTPLLEDEKYFKALKAQWPIDEEEIKQYSFKNLVIGGDGTILNNLDGDTYFSSVTVENADVYRGTLTVRLFGFSQEEKDEFPEIYRLSFYTQDVDDPTKPATINEQLERIRACIRKFNYTIFAGDVSEDRISFITSEDNVYFQHISNDILDASIDHDSRNIINYNAQYPKENIKYFNNAVDFYYKPINFDTKYYTNEELVFALFDFEILGTRLGTIIKFTDFLPNQYEIDSSVVADKTYNTLLSLTNTGYYPINEYSVESLYPYVTDHFYDKSLPKNLMLENDSKNINVVMSPFNTMKAMISSKQPMMFTHYVKLWNIMPFNISLMGMHNFATINSKVNYNDSKRITSEKYLTASAGQRMLLDGTTDNLQKYTLYKFISGKFENCPLSQGDVFYITSNNEVVYLNESSLKIDTIAADYLIVYEDVKIENVIDKNYPNYDYTNYLPSFSNLAFYKDPDDIQYSELKVPLSIPLIAQFTADAVYYDNNNILDTKYVKDKEYQSRLSDSNYASNYGFFNSKENNLADTLSSTIIVDGQTQTFKDVIINKLINNPIRNFLLYSNNLSTCKAKYNKYTNTLEFIYYGIKFIFTFQNTDYASSIKLNEYNNYEVCVINEYDKTKNNEIFISTIENIILVVNHKFKITKNENSKSNVLIENDSTLTNTISYTWDTLPYNMDFSKVIANSKYLIFNKINKTSDFKLTDDILSIVELDYLDPDKDEYDINYYAYFSVAKNLNNSNALIDEPKYLKLKYYRLSDSDTYSSCVNLCTVTKNSIESYQHNVMVYDVVNTNASIYFDDNNDYTSLNTYYISKNKSGEKELIDNLFESYEESMVGNCDLYIISQRDTILEQINDNYRPLTFSFITPNNIKFNYGYFDISYEKLLSFEKEDVISGSIIKKFILANTKAKSINTLKNVIGNKVYNKVISNEVKINYFIDPIKSIFASSWDKDYYRLYNNSDSYTLTDGYTTGVEDKSYFGSKCIVLNNDYLNIENWKVRNNVIKIDYSDSNYNIHAENKDTLILTINLTKAVYDFFTKDCETFINNWKSIKGTYSLVYLNNFIKLTLLKYFKLDDTNNFELYQFINSSYSLNANIVYEMPEDFNKNWSKVTNFKSEYINDNDEIILKVYISDYKNKTFYPKYTLSRNK